MFEPINRKSPEDRRAVEFDPAILTAALPGSVVSLDAATGKVIAADGDVPDPMWVFSNAVRLDSAAAESLTVIEAPFEARVNTDGYAGTPVAGDYLIVGTGGGAGKLAVTTVTADATTLGPVVGRCVVGPDSDGVIVFKATR